MYMVAEMLEYLQICVVMCWRVCMLKCDVVVVRMFTLRYGYAKIRSRSLPPSENLLLIWVLVVDGTAAWR